MPDPFASLIADARGFLADLAANNSRDWFAANKARYEAALKLPAERLMDRFAQEAAQDRGVTLTPKLFRPHRDVRFSKDKTPYHTHLHMVWSLGGRPGTAPGLFFGIAPDYVTVGGGVMGFGKPALDRWRGALDGAFGARMAAALDAAGQAGFTPRPPELKRVPAPFAPDHPQAGLLRRKSLTLWRDLPPSEWSDPLAALGACHARMGPVLALLEDVA